MIATITAAAASYDQQSEEDKLWADDFWNTNIKPEMNILIATTEQDQVE